MSSNTETKKADENNKDKKDEKEPKDEMVETKHSITIDGNKIDYTVKTGRIVLKYEEDKDEKGFKIKPKASIFYIAYIKDGEKPEDRPLTFSFNGGPGSSSVWLHMGLLGPKRVVAEKEGVTPAEAVTPPYSLVDNDYSLLDKTDLIFIDPVATGYSRAVDGQKNKEFHDFKKDIESVGNFIRLITGRLNRWSSSKFLIGESYGTIRAAGLSGYLQDTHNLFLNGIMLVSSVLDYKTVKFDEGHDIVPLLFFPTYAATAFYHGKLGSEFTSVKQVVDLVREFTEKEYMPALFKGDSLEGEERNNVVKNLSKFTGLSEEYIEQTNLRINIFRFCKELLRNTSGKTVGRIDSRFTGFDLDNAGESPEFDPSLVNIMGSYTSTFNDYVRRELMYENDLPYEILSSSTHSAWKYTDFQNSYVNVAKTLRRAISKNNGLKVIVFNGYYDLATPFYATEYTFNHLGLRKELRDNINMEYYEAGHMMYQHIPSLKKQKEDLAKFIDSAR